MKIAILAITTGGKKLAREINTKLANTCLLDQEEQVGKKLEQNWQDFDAFICIMATGIAVRSIAPLLEDKTCDPAIVVLDELGKNVISLLAGHLGGANDLAIKVAGLTGGRAIITTASDTLGHTALDLWARAQGLRTANREALTRASARLVNQGGLKIYSEIAVHSLPSDLHLTEKRTEADIVVSITTKREEGQLLLHPSSLVLGSGCNRGTPQEEFETALNELCATLDISPLAIGMLCSIDKKNDEVGLLEFAAAHAWQTKFFSKEEINQLTHLQTSTAALKAVGAIGVAEPCALLGARQTNLFCGKQKWKNITMAMAQAPSMLSAQAPEHVTI